MGPSTTKLLPLLICLASATLASPNIPNFSDLKIKTRRNDSINSTVETLYLRGSKQRREYFRNTPFPTKFVSISWCDERKRIALNDDAKLYAELPVVDWSEQRKRARPVPPSEMTGAEVTITIDSIDTGARRQQGPYTARHVKIRTTVESGPGAAMPSSTEERDGWYIDLPGLGCQDSGRTKRIRLRGFHRQGTAAIAYISNNWALPLPALLWKRPLQRPNKAKAQSARLNCLSFPTPPSMTRCSRCPRVTLRH